MQLALKIITAAVVVTVLTLYLYDDGAHRVYDIAISTVVIAVTSPVAAVLAIISKIKNGKVFERTDGTLRFTFPTNALRSLPFFYLAFIGKKNILPKQLKRARRSNQAQDA